MVQTLSQCSTGEVSQGLFQPHPSSSSSSRCSEGSREREVQVNAHITGPMGGPGRRRSTCKASYHFQQQ